MDEKNFSYPSSIERYFSRNYSPRTHILHRHHNSQPSSREFQCLFRCLERSLFGQHRALSSQPVLVRHNTSNSGGKYDHIELKVTMGKRTTVTEKWHSYTIGIMQHIGICGSGNLLAVVETVVHRNPFDLPAHHVQSARKHTHLFTWLMKLESR